MRVKLRKIIAWAEILTGATGSMAVLAAALGLGGGRPSFGTLAASGALSAWAGAAGFRLLDDRAGGVPLSLVYQGAQVVLFNLPFSTRFWVVLGPYLLVLVGADGPSAGLGFTLGFAPVAQLLRPLPWVGVNLLALAAFCFLWRRSWRVSVARPAGVA